MFLVLEGARSGGGHEMERWGNAARGEGRIRGWRQDLGELQCLLTFIPLFVLFVSCCKYPIIGGPYMVTQYKGYPIVIGSIRSGCIV